MLEFRAIEHEERVKWLKLQQQNEVKKSQVMFIEDRKTKLQEEIAVIEKRVMTKKETLVDMKTKLLEIDIRLRSFDARNRGISIDDL